MNQLCFFMNLSSSDIAAWAQTIVSSLAIVVGASVVFWQTRRARLELSEREARSLDGLARILIHLKDCAIEARNQKKKIERWPVGHPAEPSARFIELSEALHRFPLEAAQGEAALEALLNARRVAKEMMPLIGPEPELDVNKNFENTFHEYIGLFEQQIMLLRDEAQRLMKGERARHAAAAPA
jgi:hypothetical protein